MSARHTMRLAAIATACLKRELHTYPKPGLVSPIDNGAHRDMNCALLEASADTLQPFFQQLAAAGNADMATLRAIGIAAEAAMLRRTGGINTHRGAIFGLGLLCAAAGSRPTAGLGATVAERWGPAILSAPRTQPSHGNQAHQRHGVGGARHEAAHGFPSIYQIALPALRHARRQTHDEEAARVQAIMALIAAVADTNLLHRGGASGLDFARRCAQDFLASGGVTHPDWRRHALSIHHAFVARNLSPGGCADLLAMTLFVDAREA